MNLWPQLKTIVRRLTTHRLAPIPEPDLGNLSLFDLDIGKRGGHLFLGLYSCSGIELVLKKYGFYRHLRNKGFDNPITRIDTSDPYRHRLTVFHNEPEPESLLADLVVKKEYLSLRLPFDHPLSGHCFEALALDWLCLQNPLAPFSSNRPRLPGQEYPGLGAARMVLELLLIICYRLNLAGLVNVPAYYHTAHIFGRVSNYLDPDAEGSLTALCDSFPQLSIQKISWAVEWGCVFEQGTGVPLGWPRTYQIVALENEIKALFKSEPYRDAVRRTASGLRYFIDEEKFEEKRGASEVRLF